VTTPCMTCDSVGTVESGAATSASASSVVSEGATSLGAGDEVAPEVNIVRSGPALPTPSMVPDTGSAVECYAADPKVATGTAPPAPMPSDGHSGSTGGVVPVFLGARGCAGVDSSHRHARAATSPPRRPSNPESTLPLAPSATLSGDSSYAACPTTLSGNGTCSSAAAAAAAAVVAAAGAGVGPLTPDALSTPILPNERLVTLAYRGAWVDCEALLAAGTPDVNSQGAGGYTALHHAVRHARAGTVAALLTAGADPNVPAENGRTPVWLAACYGPVGVLDTLLRGGGRVNDVAADGRSPLHAVAMYNIGDGEARLGVLLPLASWQCLHEVHEGRTAEEWARREGHNRLADMLQEVEVGHAPAFVMCGTIVGTVMLLLLLLLFTRRY
jgi:hypothetical protein